MGTVCVRFTMTACLATALWLATSAMPARERDTSQRRYHAGVAGFVVLPGGHKQPIYLDMRDRSETKFTGTLTYDLGLREQVFKVEGTVDEEGRIAFHELPSEAGLHPHMPVRGGGKFETTNSDRLGFSGVALLRLAKTGSNEPV